MTLPFSFPDWMPMWLQLLVVVAAILLGLAFVLMPFSVFGVKTRLEAIDARLDEIQNEIRGLSLRLPEPGRSYDEGAVLRAAAPASARETARRDAPTAMAPALPPIPPASWAAEAPVVRETRSPTLRAAARVGEAARERAEPRLRRE